MNKTFKILFGFIILSFVILLSGCELQDDIYVIMNMDSELNAFGAGLSISVTSDFCLNDFEDYTDNVDDLESIQYLSAAYFTTEASNGLKGDLRLRLYQDDGTTLLCEVNIPDFSADDYLTTPLPINLTEQEINKINTYLLNPKQGKCFKAELFVNNVSDNDGLFYQLHGRVDFLTQLKVKSQL